MRLPAQVGLDTIQAFEPSSAGVPVACIGPEGSGAKGCGDSHSALEAAAHPRVPPEGAGRGPGWQAGASANQMSGALCPDKGAGQQHGLEHVLRSAGGAGGAGAGATAGHAGAEGKQGEKKGGRDVLAHSRALLARSVAAKGGWRRRA